MASRLSNPIDLPNGSAQPNSSEPSTSSTLLSPVVVQCASDCTQEIQETQETNTQDTQELHENQDLQETQAIQDTKEIDDIQQLEIIIPPKLIDQAIERYSFRAGDIKQQPECDPLFELARWIKTVESGYNLLCGPNLLRQLVRKWETRNAVHLSSDYDAYGQLLAKLPVVKFGQGQGLAALLRAAKGRPVPARARDLCQGAQDLAKLCRELWKINGGHFHLGCGAAGEVLGVSPNTALAYRRQLEAVRVIIPVQPAIAPTWRRQQTGNGSSKPIKIKGKATTYAYIAED
jgi:hypothetical protein